MLSFKLTKTKVGCLINTLLRSFRILSLLLSDIWHSLYVVLGGYDMLGRTKDQIRTTEQVNAALKACTNLKLDGLVIIGGTKFSSFSVVDVMFLFL